MRTTCFVCVVMDGANQQLVLIFKKGVEDTNGVTRIRKSKKNRQYNGQKKNYKRKNNDLQKHTHKTKDRVTPIPLKIGNGLLFPMAQIILKIISHMIERYVSINNNFYSN